MQAVINQINQILGHGNCTFALKDAFFVNKDARIHFSHNESGGTDFEKMGIGGNLAHFWYKVIKAKP